MTTSEKSATTSAATAKRYGISKAKMKAIEEEDNEMNTLEAIKNSMPKDCWTLIKEVLPLSRRVLLYGPPGTGKTWAGTHAAERIYNITITEDMSPSQLWGHFIFEGQDTKWHDGVASRAWKEGACLVINEVDAACGAVEVALHAILDDPEFASQTLDDGHTIRPHKDFCCVATMNGMPEDIPNALKDRFPVSINVDKPSKEAINALPKEYRKIVEKAYSRDGGPMLLTYRALAEFCALINNEISEASAAQAVWGNSFVDVLTQIKLGNLE